MGCEVPRKISTAVGFYLHVHLYKWQITTIRCFHEVSRLRMVRIGAKDHTIAGNLNAQQKTHFNYV